MTNELGKAGATPPFLSGQWFYRMGLGLFGQTLFPMIVTTLLACFACDFQPVASGGNALARDGSIGCLGKSCTPTDFWPCLPYVFTEPSINLLFRPARSPSLAHLRSQIVH